MKKWDEIKATIAKLETRLANQSPLATDAMVGATGVDTAAPKPPVPPDAPTLTAAKAAIRLLK